MLTLAIESSCDESSVSLIRNGVIIENLIASQAKLHSDYGGVVPELAVREHSRNLPPLVRETLQKHKLTASDLDLIAATRGPGLPQALMAGYTVARALAFSLEKPFIGIHHHEGHLFSPWISGDPPSAGFSELKPNISLIVSGGHTLLVHVETESRYQVIGKTVDDAAGECYDKTAKLLGLPYPGGPLLDKLAQKGDASRFSFPSPMIRDRNDNFSFSGLKTSVRYFLQKNPTLKQDSEGIQDVCAGIQKAISDVLVTKLFRAAKRLGVSCVTCSGGVSCNSSVRDKIRERGQSEGIEVRLSSPCFSTDNAAMIGIVAERRFNRGCPTDDLSLESVPNWKLADLDSGTVSP